MSRSRTLLQDSCSEDACFAGLVFLAGFRLKALIRLQRGRGFFAFRGVPAQMRTGVGPPNGFVSLRAEAFGFVFVSDARGNATDDDAAQSTTRNAQFPVGDPGDGPAARVPAWEKSLTKLIVNIQ